SLYNRGDRRRWYWPCPHCGEYFQPCGDVVAGFRDIADPVLASEAAYIQCPSCSGRIMPEQKRELNGRGVWLRDGESINADGSRYGDPRRSRIASFWMEGPAAAYQTLSQLVYKLLTAEQEYETTGSEETLKTVINTDWGLPYLPRASMEQRKSELLEQRAEPVPPRSVPDGVNFLAATVDVQAGRHRRFVVQVTGYGSRGERWIVDRYNITQSLRCDNNGESLRIDPASYPPIRAGDICVTETDKPDTLNAFLDAPTEADLRPEVMKQFEEMLKEAIRVAGEVESNRHASEEAANSARQSEQNASKHAAEAGKAAEQSGSNAQATASARDDSQRYAMSAAASAESAERSEREATECASSASQSASSAALSASTATEKELGAGNHASSAKESKTAAELAAERATSAAQNAAADAATQLRNEVREEIDRASGLAERAEAANEGAWQALAEAQEIAKTPGPPGDKGDKG
ncbi:TPA: terminase gpA endonuclease subunit, partial [Escherichia coli]